MAFTTFVDCIRRDPAHSMQAMLHAIGGARGGANVVVVKTDDSRIVGLARDWARDHGVRGTVERDRGFWRVRLYLLPSTFGALPAPARRAKQAA